MIYIWIRRTLNWADEEEAAAGITDPWLKEKVPLWNATFNISYQRFRLPGRADRGPQSLEGGGRRAGRLGPDPGWSPRAPGRRR